MWLVIKNKETGGLSIQTRRERENQISVLIDEKIIVPTIVVKEFKTKEEAEKYIRRLGDADK